MITALSILYCNSRTFPGKEYCNSLSWQAASNSGTGFLYLSAYIFAKCFASIKISSFLFRNGGMVISTVLILYTRSFLNLFSLASSCKGRLVAHISRISIGYCSLLPNRLIFRLCNTVSSFACCCKDIFPISSKNRVPFWQLQTVPSCPHGHQ